MPLPSTLLSQLLTLPAPERARLARVLLASVEQPDAALTGQPRADDEDAAARLSAEIKRIVAEIAQTDSDRIELTRRLDEQGLDSLHVIVLRERLQEEIGAVFSDEEWPALQTPGQILARLIAGPDPGPRTVQPRREATGVRVGSLSADDLEIGMPLTGRNNLAETPLLQYLGDRRWRQVSEIVGVPSREIVDEEGERLYATFFYVDVAFPPDRPMAAFGENDRFHLATTIARYGTSMVDGVSYLIPEDVTAGRDQDPPFASLDDATAAGVPAVRLSNIFVRQFGGAEWLRKGRPVHPGFASIPPLSEPPDSYVLMKQAEQAGYFDLPGGGWTPLTDGPMEREYRLIPDRDLNGVGLVYFANYPMFLDICERDVLVSAVRPLSDALVDRRTVVRRRSAYLNNAAASDTLRIRIEPWAVLRRGAGARREAIDLHLHVNCRMFRRSDDRLMMVSTVRKVVPGVSLAEIPAESAASLGREPCEGSRVRVAFQLGDR